MPDPFAEMEEVLAASVLGADATWRAKDGGPVLALRVVMSRKDEPAFGAAARSAPQVTARIAADALPGRPCRGDLLAVGGQGYVVETVEDLRNGASYELTLATVRG